MLRETHADFVSKMVLL